MRLLIVSGMPHYLKDGDVVGWGPTAHEIDYLAELFDEVRHIAPLYPGLAPPTALPYGSKRIVFVPIRASGGARLWDKLRILARFPSYLRAIARELRHADVVHVRCPDNVSLLAILLLAVAPLPKVRWVKYAGNWQPRESEAWSYTFQRWWLRHGPHRALVTVNGSWAGQPAHIRSFLNPCLTNEELEMGRAASGPKQLTSPIRLLFVGRLEAEKGVERAIQVLLRLQLRNCAATLDFVGDGPRRSLFERAARELGVEERVIFHGWLPRPALAPLYARSHVMLLPTKSSEGWPKVLSEAMAYGVVPVASDVSSIPQYLDSFQTGRALNADDIEEFAEAVRRYGVNPATWKDESKRAVEAARLFSYERYVKAVDDLLGVSSMEREASSMGNR